MQHSIPGRPLLHSEGGGSVAALADPILSPTANTSRRPYAIRPFDAMRAAWRLARNPRDTVQGARLAEAIEGRAPQRMLKRARQTKSGRTLLARRPELLARLKDERALAALPEGSLGRQYWAFCRREGITPGGLDDAVRGGLSDARARRLSKDEAFLSDWVRDSHDLFHVLTGCDTSPLGETLVLLFTAIQTRNRALWALAITGVVAVLLTLKLRPRALVRTFRTARKARHLLTLDWTQLLDRPLGEVRARTGVVVLFPG